MPNAVIRITAVVGCSARVVRSTSMPSLPPIFRSLKHDVEVAIVQPLDRGVAVAGFVDFVPRLDQPAHEPAPQRVVIVGNQNSTHIRPSVYLNHARRARDRQRDPEPRAGLGAAAEIDAPVVRVDDLPDDGQTQTGALGLGREERIEDAVAQFCRHARTVVRHVDDDDRRRVLRRARERRVRLDGAERRAIAIVPLPSSASNALVSRLVNTWQS